MMSALLVHTRDKGRDKNILDQPLKVCRNRATTNLQHSKRTVLRLTNMPYTQDVLVNRLQSAHESIWLRHFEVRRQCLAVAEAGGEKGEDRGDLVRSGVSIGHEATEVVGPGCVICCGFVVEGKC